jgi:hypothetical protein
MIPVSNAPLTPDVVAELNSLTIQGMKGSAYQLFDAPLKTDSYRTE